MIKISTRVSTVKKPQDPLFPRVRAEKPVLPKGHRERLPSVLIKEKISHLMQDNFLSL
jgi:hypothetical protein